MLEPGERIEAFRPVVANGKFEDRAYEKTLALLGPSIFSTASYADSSCRATAVAEPHQVDDAEALLSPAARRSSVVSTGRASVAPQEPRRSTMVVDVVAQLSARSSVASSCDGVSAATSAAPSLQRPSSARASRASVASRPSADAAGFEDAADARRSGTVSQQRMSVADPVRMSLLPPPRKTPNAASGCDINVSADTADATPAKNAMHQRAAAVVATTPTATKPPVAPSPTRTPVRTASNGGRQPLYRQSRTVASPSPSRIAVKTVSRSPVQRAGLRMVSPMSVNKRPVNTPARSPSPGALKQRAAGGVTQSPISKRPSTATTARSAVKTTSATATKARFH
jgi:hypothetical protein